MRNHRPLQRPKDNPRADGLCPGNDTGARKIRRNVRLGSEMTTDVFELRLDPLKATDAGLGQAMAIGAALREALAARLGIDAEEMGAAAAPSARDDGGRRASVFLYDKASGGSGFAITAEIDLPDLLRAAAERLDCTAGCAHGCPECVLRRDLQFDMGPIDRPAALNVLRDEVLPHLALPEALRVFGPETGAITEPLPVWLRRHIAAGRLSRLTLFLQGEARDWDLLDWPGTELLAAAERAGAKVALVLPTSEVTKLDFPQKMDLVRTASRSGASLHSMREMPAAEGCPVLAAADIDGQSLQIAVSAPGGEQFGSDWGHVGAGPGLTGQREAPAMGPALSLAKLAAFGEGNSAHVEIRHEFDGPIKAFGKAFWKTIMPLRPQAFAGKCPVVRAVYSDRYLRSPLAARLLYEIVRAMPGRHEETIIEIISERTMRAATEPSVLHEAWTDDRDRTAVLEALLPRASVALRTKRDCPHARSLLIDFADGSSVTIYLDQGLGAWRTAGRRPVRFDGAADVARQVAELKRVDTDVEIQEKGEHASPLWITW
jgi:hypothetical protein